MDGFQENQSGPDDNLPSDGSRDKQTIRRGPLGRPLPIPARGKRMEEFPVCILLRISADNVHAARSSAGDSPCSLRGGPSASCGKTWTARPPGRLCGRF